MILVEEGKPLYLIGLDLGQAQDFTAISILQQIGTQPAHYHLRHLERFPLKTSYQVIADSLASLTRREEVAKQQWVVIADSTGVGAPVIDMLKRVELKPVAVTITAGFEVTRVSGREFRVPKRDLVSTLRLLLDDKRLKIAQGLPDAKTLVDELLNFRIKLTKSGSDTYEPWREGEHDDLVLATALAAWFGEHQVKASTQEPAERPRKKRLLGNPGYYFGR